jgi:hypothetical protein
MTVRISWANANATADSVILYRSATPFAQTALPAPLVTLAGNATTYDDTTVTRNTVAYYRAKIVKGTEELITPLMTMGHFPDSGPGPQTLLRGNWALGYFGKVPVANMWTLAQFRTATGATGLPAAAAESNLTVWHKFIRNGKIIFVPGCPMTNATTTWSQIYALGLVYGTNDNGAVPSTLTVPPTPVNQFKTVTLGAYTFLVRLPLGCTMPVNAIIGTGFTTTLEGSEWDETISRCYTSWAAAYNSARFDDVAITATSPVSAITQHVTTNGKQCLRRGTPAASPEDPYDVTGAFWVPFVELIP